MNDVERIYLGMPSYGHQSAAAGRGFWRACRDMDRVWLHSQEGSLLCSNFNQIWCGALNLVHHGERVDYFAMLHDDIGPEDWWLDMLIGELNYHNLDVLGVASPIKDTRGLTSMALHGDDNWMPAGRLTMHDLFELPETFTSKDLGKPLLLNTGCWVCRFDFAWAHQVHFEINDRIVFNKSANRYQAQTEPEDWYFSRLCHDLGLKIGATRKVRLVHRGDMDFTNEHPWGSEIIDRESCQVSPVPGAFPADIPGWLLPAEGRKLAELAAGKRVLEIGSYCGRSTVCLARAARHVTAIDYFDGRGTPSPQQTLQDFLGHLNRYGVSDKVETRYPDEALPFDEYDFAFIDGAHDFDSVIDDIHRVRSVLSSDGMIAFHDYQQPAHLGVTRAIDDLLGDGGELVSVTETLAVVRPPARIPLEV